MKKDFYIPFILPPTDPKWEAVYAEMVNAIDDILFRYSRLTPIEQRCDDRFLYEALQVDESSAAHQKVFTSVYPYMRLIAFSDVEYWLDSIKLLNVRDDGALRLTATFIPKAGLDL
jgi:hypothetical protein